MRKTKLITLISSICLVLVLLLLPIYSGCTQSATEPSGTTTPEKELPPKDKIIIGMATSLSGPLNSIRAAGFQPIYEMWVDEVNADGGIYVAEYGEKLPVELLIYDDKSDVETMTRLLEKLMVEDKVDFIFAPCGTAMLFAAAPIAEKHGYILIGEEGGARSLEKLGQTSYFFSTLNTDVQQMPALADIFAEVGVKTAAITYIADLHGIEYSETMVNEFTEKGIEIVFNKSHDFLIKDLSPILKEAKNANVDAMCVLSYPDQTILATAQALELNYNPNAFFLSVGPYADFYKAIFGPAVEGIMGCGAWNEKSSPGSQEFSDKYQARYNVEPNYWGGTIFYSSLQIFQQAIEKAGTLDQKQIRDIIANDKFDTVLGPTWFDGYYYALECYPGEIGQWQNGVFEVIDPGSKRTAPPIYPKPAWPAPPAQ